MDTPFLLHIPHASTNIPDAYRGDYLCDLSKELYYMTDWYTDELFDYPAPKLVFPISRLVCDVERFRDDAKEEMAARGMGVCYTVGYDGKPLRQINEAKKEKILADFYDPHHARLTEYTAQMLRRFGCCTIVDCHSFSGVPLPYEPNQDPIRPEICIGTDQYHTPLFLKEMLVDFFLKRGYSVAINAPYSGAIVPLRYYHRDRRVCAVMIEVNRGLYLDGNGEKTPGFSRLKHDLAAALEEIM